MTEPDAPIVTITGSSNTTTVLDVSEDTTSVVGVASSSESSNRIRIERIVLTKDDISAKQVELNKSPVDPVSVVVYPEGGIPQFAGVDFIVNGNKLIWDNLGLDGFLDEGETISVQY